MASALSAPVESLIDSGELTCDVLVVGSGYGGAVAAMRLAGEGRRVYLFERGKEYALGDFPEHLGELPGHIRFHRGAEPDPIGDAAALFDLRLGAKVSALVGNGLGGGSLINASVALEPEPYIFEREEWPEALRRDARELRESMAAIRDLLMVQEDPEQTPKRVAFARLVGALGGVCKPAPISVAFRPGPNRVGVEQNACVRCGNCVTGCNRGAKGTLAMNVLPLAKARGARLYTGATVDSVQPGPHGTWIARFRRTASAKGPLRNEYYEITARDVILAAGTFGSTEILQRSERAKFITPSKALGSRFSTNGDLLAFGYAQRSPVNAVAVRGSLAPREPGKPNRAGPTITSHARLNWGGLWNWRLLLEDGAVPASLARVLGEIVGFRSLGKRYEKDALPAWFLDRPSEDPLGVHPEALQHTQILLGMGDDGAPGTLALEGEAMAIRWPKEHTPSEKFFAEVDLKLRGAEDSGFDGGDYLPNPFWQALPSDVAKEMEEGAPGGLMLTVHPLGGCPMGESASGGVVDHLGRVFDDRGGHHEGLHVMDGAIIPRALATNPFLTIAALADRSAKALLRRRGWSESPLFHVGEAGAKPERSRAEVLTPASRVDACFIERLHGVLPQVPAWVTQLLPPGLKLAPERWLVAEVKITMDDVDRWLKDPQTRFAAQCTLYANTALTDVVVPHHLHELAMGEGNVRLLTLDSPGGEADQRSEEALEGYIKHHRIGDVKATLLRTALARGWSPTLSRLARNHGLWRRMEYGFELELKAGGTLKLTGTKVLALGRGRRGIWAALTELPAVLEAAGQRWETTLHVDLVDLSRKAPLQITRSPHSPEAVAALAGMAGLFLRAGLQTYLWSFAAPTYPKRKPEGAHRLGPLRVEETAVPPEEFDLPVAAAEDSKDKITLRLTRYANPGGTPVLFIHGLAHGANVFTTDTIAQPLAASLYEAGWDVWLLDHRLSPLLDCNVAAKQWNMDQIARIDIRAAVEEVCTRTGHQAIDVFAHCIGAGAFSMAVLDGSLQHTDATGAFSRVRNAVIHAVPPWVIPSTSNRLRGNLAAFLKDALRDVETVDPIPPARPPSTLEGIIDRLAGSFQWPLDEAQAHDEDADDEAMGRAICNRMTLYYGVEWIHGNLAPATHRRLSELVGIGNLETFRHIFFLAMRGRVTDRRGRNIYLRDQHVEKYWTFPVLFCHGLENRVFSPLSSLRSALRLERVHAKRATSAGRVVRLYRPPAYGHMDFLFGRNAPQAVHPRIVEFLRNPQKFTSDPRDAQRDPHIEPWGRARCGPIIGDAAKAGDGNVRLRVWLEPDDDNTSPPRTPQFSALVSGARVDAPAVRVEDTGERERYGRYWIYDVTVPKEASSLRASVKFDRGGTAAVGWSPAAIFETRPIDLFVRKPGQSPNADEIKLDVPWFRKLAGNVASPGCTYLLGSCRYPGTPFERERADAVFKKMAEKVDEANDAIDFVLFVGDQIYSDATANLFDTLEPVERYTQRYRDAFRSEHMGTLLRSVPVYMALDDHELADNWQGLPAPDSKYQDHFELARDAARNYLWRMGPRSYEQGDPNALWYRFDQGGLPFFVLDVRSERRLRTRTTAADQARMLSDAQLAALDAWLGETTIPLDRPRFIVGGLPLAPVRNGEADGKLWRNADGWHGFPGSLTRLLDIIVRHADKTIVFVAGDYHFSACAELTVDPSHTNMKVYQIVGSGLYAPLPFTNERPEDYPARQQVRGPAGQVWFNSHYTLLTQEPSHFLQVKATLSGGRDPWHVDVIAYDSMGSVLKRHALF